MSQGGYEVRLYAVEPVAAGDTAHALVRVFGVELQTAEHVLSSLPCVVRHDASEEEARQIAAALQAIGGRAEVVAKPIRPVRVTVIGAAPDPNEPAPRPRFQLSNAAPSAAPPEPPQALQVARVDAAPHTHESAARGASVPALRTSDTLKLGTQDLELLGLRAWRAPAAVAPAPAAVAAPAGLEPGPSPSLAASSAEPASSGLTLDTATGSSFVVTHDASEWVAPSQPPLAAPLELAVPVARPRALELAPDPAVQAPHNPLALPASQPPAATLAPVRKPSERTRPPARVVASAPAVAATPLGQRVLAPLEVTAGILNQAGQGGWQEALRAHPAAGFVFVLGATTALCLAILAVI